MLCDIIKEVVTSEPDLQIVGQLAARVDLAGAVDQTRADVVVVGLRDHELPSDCLALFDSHPRTRLLGIAADGRRAFLYELRPQRTPLGEVSPAGLIEAIRGTGAPVQGDTP